MTACCRFIDGTPCGAPETDHVGGKCPRDFRRTYVAATSHCDGKCLPCLMAAQLSAAQTIPPEPEPEAQLIGDEVRVLREVTAALRRGGDTDVLVDSAAFSRVVQKLMAAMGETS